MRTQSGRAPTRLELLTMAYVDGELPDSARHGFQARLRAEPALLRELEELTALRTLLQQVGVPTKSERTNIALKGVALTP